MGEVKILGLESNNYLAMNAEGQLYAEEDGSNESTIFIEKTHGSYLVYLRYLRTIYHIIILYSGDSKTGCSNTGSVRMQDFYLPSFLIEGCI